MARLNMSQLEEMAVLFWSVWLRRNESVLKRDSLVQEDYL